MAIPRKLTANFVETDVDGEILIVDLDGGELLSLSGTGRAVWQLIDGVRSGEEIVALLERDYAALDGVIAQDVADLLDRLARARLLTLT